MRRTKQFLFALIVGLFVLLLPPPYMDIFANNEQVNPVYGSSLSELASLGENNASLLDDASPMIFTLNSPLGTFAQGDEITLTGLLTNTSTAPLNSIQLDLPRHTAVHYTTGPTLPPEGIEGGTVEMGDLEATQTLPLSLTVRIDGRPENGLIELPFRLRTAATDPITATVTLTIDPLALPENSEGAAPLSPDSPTSDPAPWQMTYTPPGSSAFTGAATTSYPIAVPPGIGGLTPSLVLSYNSRGIEDLDQPISSSGFGTGWGMPQAEIINGNATRMFDTEPGFDICPNFWDQFTLSLNGVSYQLKRRPEFNRYGRYDALGDPTLYIEYKSDSSATNVTGDYWLIRTADGTEYVFGKSEQAEQAIGPLMESCPANSPQSRNNNFMAHSWKLESITDVYGHLVRYTYGTACSQNGGSCRRFPISTHVAESTTFASPPPAQPANQFRREADVALYRIEYNFSGSSPQTIIQFDYTTHNSDALGSERTPLTGRWRPSRVIIYQAGQVLAAYTFAYTGQNHYFDSAFLSTHFWWLINITAYGSDYNPAAGTGTALPSQTFSYEQSTNSCGQDFDDIIRCVPILTKVDNGYGGVTRFVYDTYNWDGGLGGDWFVVREMYTWDGVRYPYTPGNNNTAANRTLYGRTGFTACYDKDPIANGPNCRSLAIEASLSLVGFSGVTIDAQTYTAGAWTTLSKSQEEFDISTYWKNGKTTWQRTLNPTGTVELTEEELTWVLAGAYGVTPQLSRQDHTIYADGLTLHTYETFSYLNGASDFGALYEKRAYDGAGALYRCTQHAYAHQTSGTIWLVNRPLRQTMYDGNCGAPKLAETLYRYDSPTSPADNDLNGKAALEYTLVWRGNTTGDTSYATTRQTYYGVGANYGLPHQTITYDDYSTTTFPISTNNTTTILSYTALGLPTSSQTTGSGVSTETTTLTYDPLFAWQPASVTDPNDDITSYTYDIGLLTILLT